MTARSPFDLEPIRSREYRRALRRLLPPTVEGRVLAWRFRTGHGWRRCPVCRLPFDRAPEVPVAEVFFTCACTPA